MEKIIDISQWNHVTDWDAVKRNVDAVIIRMGFTYSRNGYLCVDNNYVQNRKACKSRNIPYSMYFFTNAITEDEARREADFVVYECRDMARYALPVFCDSEKVDGLGRADNLDVDTRTRCVKAFCDRLQANGVPSGVYSNPTWLTNNLDQSRLPYSLWIAHWGVSEPSIKDYLIWQYTNVGHVDGIEGNVDISRTKPVDTSPIDKVTALAFGELDYLEKRNGDLNYLYSKDLNAGSANYTKYNYELHKLQPYNMDYPAAWCMCFISWLFVELFGLDKAKRMLCGDIDDYTVTAMQRFKASGRFHKDPQIGDVIFFGSNGTPNHVGYVYKVNAGAVHTIEGNTSSTPGVVPNGGCVRAKSYLLTYSSILGYGRPLY